MFNLFISDLYIHILIINAYFHEFNKFPLPSKQGNDDVFHILFLLLLLLKNIVDAQDDGCFFSSLILYLDFPKKY